MNEYLKQIEKFYNEEAEQFRSVCKNNKESVCFREFIEHSKERMKFWEKRLLDYGETR